MSKLYIELAASLLSGLAGLFGAYYFQSVARVLIFLALFFGTLALNEWLKERGETRRSRRYIFLLLLVSTLILSYLAPLPDIISSDTKNNETTLSSKPNLDGTIETTSLLEHRKNGISKTLVSMIATIRSTGSKTTAENYKLAIKLSDGTVKQGIRITVNDQLLPPYPNGTREFIYARDALDVKTFRPIDLIAQGRLLFEIELTPDRDWSLIEEYQLSFTDFKGNWYTVVTKPDNSGPNTNRNFSGMELRFQESQRRGKILQQLRQEYVLSHDGISPGLMAGTEPLPEIWLKKRLAELEESWSP